MWLLSAFFGKDLSKIKIDRPIFIVGLPGSGASLVHDLLCDHEQAASPEKSDQLQLKRIWGVRRAIRKILHELGADPSGSGERRRFIHRCPPLVTDIKALSEGFPDAYFVHVVREGRHAGIQAIKNELTNYAELRYDEFLTDPTGQILWLLNRVALPRPSPENSRFWELLSSYLPATATQASRARQPEAAAPPNRQNGWDIDRGATLTH